MLQKSLRLLSVIIAISIGFMAMAKMSDQEIINFIKQQSLAGKTEQQIGKELLAKGITQEQIETLLIQYTLDGKTGSHGNNDGESGLRSPNDINIVAPEDQVGNVLELVVDNNIPKSSRQIYGKSIFTNNNLTFEPNENTATPEDYRLGPGDEVIIDIWGANEDRIRETISPEGSISVSQIGPVYLNGLTVAEANSRLKNLFSSKYSGLEDEETDINLTLGNIRSILVNVMGEARVPGSYRLSPFSTVFNAIYRAGGITDIGTLRNINVLRNGRILYDIDIYDYLFEGKQDKNIRLQENDVIIIPPYENLINLEGNVKRPMFYEIKNGESISDLIRYAGGFNGEAFGDQITVSRSNGTDNEIYNLSSDEFNAFNLKDGDIVTIGKINDRFANRVELQGAIMQPGMYSVDKANSLLKLLNLASGLTEDAFTDRIIIYRQNDNLTLSAIGVDLKAIMEGRQPDFTLQKNDVIFIPSTLEIFDQGELSINGLVNKPGTYPYAEGTTIEDLIVMAGGLKIGASTARVDVSRRIVDPTSLQQTNQTAEVFSFALKDGLVLTDDPDFKLMPYDIVQIRRSPGYQAQKLVQIEGEVLFEGQFALQNRNERVTDIIKRAGGIVDGAYIKGARLIRQMTAEEKMSRDESLRLIRNQIDESVDLDQLVISDTYSVGLQLDKALENPGSYYDLVLKAGDRLIIPEEISTVKIGGEVIFPNTVGYIPDKDYKYYLNQAGGFGPNAKKSKTFIIYMNGTVARASGKAKIEPGCQIIVPTKPAGSGVSWPQIIGYISSFASLGLTAAAIYNIFK